MLTIIIIPFSNCMLHWQFFQFSITLWFFFKFDKKQILFIFSNAFYVHLDAVTSAQLKYNVEQENLATEGAAHEEDVTASYELLQQQLKQANETIATLMEQMSRMSSTSKCLTVLGLGLIKLY